MLFYRVIVGNLGTVYDGADQVEARHVFNHYRHLSVTNQGRAAGEPVTLMLGDEIIFEYDPEES